MNDSHLKTWSSSSHGSSVWVQLWRWPPRPGWISDPNEPVPPGTWDWTWRESLSLGWTCRQSWFVERESGRHLCSICTPGFVISRFFSPEGMYLATLTSSRILRWYQHTIKAPPWWAWAPLIVFLLFATKELSQTYFSFRWAQWNPNLIYINKGLN